MFHVNNTVICYNLDNKPPKYGMDTLALGPKDVVLEKIDPKDVLAELDGLLRSCQGKGINQDGTTDINVKTLTYIKNCSKQMFSEDITINTTLFKSE